MTTLPEELIDPNANHADGPCVATQGVPVRGT